MSTGADVTDYYFLYRHILDRRPMNLIEFGSGKTSIVMGHALQEAGYGGRLYTLEDVPKYHEDFLSVLPSHLNDFVTPLYSPKRVTEYREVWGVCYSELPDVLFDFAFVDGPTEHVDGRKGACLDILFLLERQPDNPIDIVFDYRMPSELALQSFCPKGTVKFDPALLLGFAEGVCGKDMHQAPEPKRLTHFKAM